ncbi:MAG TPA: VWA domain-containing protein [Gemmataceae bacterium]|nr:VWA domain-containing protein [Gemmataceae bacterium]
MHHWFSNTKLLWLLTALPLLALLGFLARRRRRAALLHLGSLSALGALSALRDRLAGVRGMALSLGIALLVVGIAGPQWGRETIEAATGRDVVVVLDASRSMLAEQPSRFERAKAALADLSWEVQRLGGHRLGLVVFAGGAKIACPLTHDYDHFREIVGQIDAAELPEELRPESSRSGTRIGAGLVEAVEAAHDARFRGYQEIVLVSDGDDPARDEEWRGGISAARARAIPVHVVGVGDPDNASPIPTPSGPLRRGDETVLTRLEEGPLEEIARLTGGKYVAARTKALALGELFRACIEPRAGHDDADGLDALQVYRPRYAWFLGPALALLALDVLLGRRGAPLPGFRLEA